MKLKNITVVFFLCITFHILPTREPIAEIYRQQENPLHQSLLKQSFDSYESTRNSNQSTGSLLVSPSLGPSNASVMSEQRDHLDSEIPEQHFSIAIPPSAHIERRQIEDRQALNEFCKKFACCSIPTLLLGAAIMVLHKTRTFGM